MTGIVASLLMSLAALLTLGFLVPALRARLPRLAGLGGPRRLRLIERIEIGDKASVALVRLDGTDLLLGASRESVTLLEKIPVAAVPAVEPRATFSKRLAEVLDRVRRPPAAARSDA